MQRLALCDLQELAVMHFRNMQREKRQQEILGADGDFFLPINQRADDPLETFGIEMATVDTAIPADNKGYQMLQKMGWGGRGLGRKGDGESHSNGWCS